MASDADHDENSRSPSLEHSDISDAGDAGDDHDMEDKSDQPGNNGEKKKPSNSKDPSRPRRKKARRACFACQRAHLTCGDERPCQRCIKRGLADACQDGVRKKAKYLHDAPPEALMGPRFQYMNEYSQQQQSPQSPTYPIVGVNELYPSRSGPGSYSNYGATSNTSTMPMTDGLMGTNFGSPQSPLAGQAGIGGDMSQAAVQSLGQTLQQPTSRDGPARIAASGFDTNIWDPVDLSQYDFDPTSFNFGNHYGALEFGMLGHMSGAATGGASPPPDSGGLNQATAFPTPNTITNSNYSDSPVNNQSFMFGQDSGLEDWRGPAQTQSNVRQGGADMMGVNRTRDGQLGLFNTDFPRAFSVGMNSAAATPTSGRSPQQSIRTLEDQNQHYRPSSTGRAAPLPPNGSQNGLDQGTSLHNAASRLTSSKRKRGEPSAIYTNVTQPYSYTTGFHSLFAMLSKRYATSKTLRIAKALASIRPSFISCTKTLNREDLIFMEKCFQRTLFEYEDFINASGTPTLICRRTGEIAAVGKEFCILTQWRKDVLLGREANLNVNLGDSSSGSAANTTGTSSRASINTPRIPEGMIDDSHIHPVSLAEIMDQDSVVQFYEDFARLAFGDSHGVVTTRYKLLKYQAKEQEGRIALGRDKGSMAAVPKRKRQPDGPRVESANEAGIDDIGEGGKVECSCCWTVKRDLFDLPMMIIMNFLPCI